VIVFFLVLWRLNFRGELTTVLQNQLLAHESTCFAGLKITTSKKTYWPEFTAEAELRQPFPQPTRSSLPALLIRSMGFAGRGIAIIPNVLVSCRRHARLVAEGMGKAGPGMPRSPVPAAGPLPTHCVRAGARGASTTVAAHDAFWRPGDRFHGPGGPLPEGARANAGTVAPRGKCGFPLLLAPIAFDHPSHTSGLLGFTNCSPPSGRRALRPAGVLVGISNKTQTPPRSIRLLVVGRVGWEQRGVPLPSLVRPQP